MNIQGKNVLVTGSTRGIGRALVEAALARGAARVYATARNRAALESSELRRDARVVPLELDITSPEQAQRAAQLAKDVDVLINNAGVLASFGVLSGTAADVQRDLDTNFFGLLHLARAFAPVLAERKEAALVSVLSVASLASMPALGGYSSSKAAAWSLTQALRAELGKRGVKTFAVFPGPVDTDMIRSFELPKTAPALVARAILDGVEASVLDIFPDPMSREVGALFAKDPMAVERQFATPM
ncbi:MAG TPA: SDR family oxidoreductase [Polyangiaceae bacterium]|nr:SDR family oxidoreductase [Polyangiaceae bacterium]